MGQIANQMAWEFLCKIRDRMKKKREEKEKQKEEEKKKKGN